MFRYLPFILKNTLRNKRRSLLTIGSVGASFCLLGVLFAIYSAFFLTEPNEHQALRLITRNRVSLTQTMPAAYKQKIATVPGIKAVYIQQWFGGEYKDQQADRRNIFARFAVEAPDFFAVQQDVELPEDQKQAFIRERTGCIVGRKLADKLGFKVGDRLTLKGDIFPGNYELTVRGIYDSKEDSETLFFHIEYLYESLPASRRDFAGTFCILTKTREDTASVPKMVDDMFRNSPVQTRTETEAAFILSFASFLGNIKLFLFIICSAVTFTILLVSANTMAMTVRERIKEVGVMKTLGFTRQGVLGMILGEATLLSLLGAAVGCLLAAMMVAGLREVAGQFSFQLRTMTLTLPAIATCLTLGVLTGLVASLVPAIGASRTPIIDALKYAG